MLYHSVENEVSIVVPAYGCDDILLQSPDCTIRGAGCRYSIRPADVSSTAILVVHSKKSNTVLDTLRIPVKAFPNSLAVKIAAGKENKGPVLKDGPFLIAEDGLLPESLFKIVGFEVTLTRKDSILYQCKTKGSHFEPATITAMEKAQAGDRLLLENIEVSGPDRRKRKMSLVLYTFR